MMDGGSYVQNSGFAASSYLDADYLMLPFFDGGHRAAAARLQTWLRDNEAAIEATLDQPPKEATRNAVRLLGEAGWIGTALAEPVDFRTISILREGFAYRDDLLDFAFSIQCLSALLLLLWGSESQRSRFLPELLGGKRVGAFAMTEKESGSNLAAVALEATEVDQGYCLNGEKNWIANADIADDLVLLARTGPVGSGATGLSIFFVDTATSGVVAKAVELIAPRPFGHIEFIDCTVSADRLVGDLGTGLAIALDTLEQFRLTVGAAANGLARRALYEARRHVTRVRGTGDRLADIAAVRQKLAKIGVTLHTARLCVAQAAWNMDRGGDCRSLTSSLAKMVATETAQSVVDSCVQLHGAAGLVSHSVPERLYRQVRSLRIYEGASEIQEAILGDAVTFGFLG